MTVKELKEWLIGLDDNLEILIPRSYGMRGKYEVANMVTDFYLTFEDEKLPIGRYVAVYAVKD